MLGRWRSCRSIAGSLHGSAGLVSQDKVDYT